MSIDSIHIFQNQTLQVLIDCFLVYSNADDNAKRYNAQRYYLPKGIIKNYEIINRKNFYDQPTLMQKDTTKLTTGQVEDYTTDK